MNYFLDHPVLYNELYSGSPCNVKWIIFWITLYCIMNYILDHPVLYSELYSGSPCNVIWIIFWITLYCIVNYILDHPVLYNKLNSGSPCTEKWIIFWITLYWWEYMMGVLRCEKNKYYKGGRYIWIQGEPVTLKYLKSRVNQ